MIYVHRRHRDDVNYIHLFHHRHDCHVRDTLDYSHYYVNNNDLNDYDYYYYSYGYDYDYGCDCDYDYDCDENYYHFDSIDYYYSDLLNMHYYCYHFRNCCNCRDESTSLLMNYRNNCYYLMIRDMMNLHANCVYVCVSLSVCFIQY